MIYSHITGDSLSIADDFIYGILEDRRGRLLVQTGKGLEILDIQTGKFKRYAHTLSTDFDIPHVLHEDSQGNLWVGSKQQGLFRVDRTGVTFRQYTQKDGLSSNSISGILEDESGNLWISTQRGLSKMVDGVDTPERIRFQTYTVKDGLQGSEFKRGAYIQLSDGNMLFAGQGGFNLFEPSQIKRNPFVPPVILTGLKLFNKPVDFRETDWLDQPISTSSQLTISHEKSVFTFEFTALNFMLPERNQYAYRMSGFEENWNEVGARNHATYTNLDPGTYTFQVKATNNDGVWNQQGTSLTLTILPPWWDKPLVKGIGVLTLLGLILGGFWLRTIQLKQSQEALGRQVALRTADLKSANELSESRRQEIQRQNETLLETNHELERQADEIQRMADEIADLNEAKLRFFTNISHELRTPLNLILWPLETLMEEASSGQDDKLRETYARMHGHVGKLTRLINQLLTFRKLHTGSLEVQYSRQSVHTCIESLFQSFQTWAERKDVQYSFTGLDPSRTACIDVEKLGIILSNLLSNAFKYVEKGGTITIAAHIKREGPQEVLQVRVEDDGKGIATDKLAHIFDRFFEGKDAGVSGTGIGLALVKDLVTLQGGTVEVTSEEHVGTTFSVEIPLPETCPEVLESPVPIESVPSPIPSLGLLQEEDRPDQAPLILLVEDNPEIILHMQQRLQKSYQIATAADGKEGWEKATELVPDLMISDVMMPEMDGFELCKKVKEDPRTSHIPILLLTARTREENRYRGLNLGADDYLTKPFKFDLLQLKINNILFTRQRLKAQFLQTSLSVPKSVNPSNQDEAFLKKAAEVVEAHLEDTQFGVEDFSKAFNMSRRNVLRKLKGVTGLSINEFIRHTRLKRAHELLMQGEVNVSEAAYAVGFTDPKYFSACFKKQYGVSPSEFRTA